MDLEDMEKEYEEKQRKLQQGRPPLNGSLREGHLMEDFEDWEDYMQFGFVRGPRDYHGH